MPFMKAGWATIRTSYAISQVLPYDDVIDHKYGIACACKPEVETEMYQGELHWRITHNSFDEYLDEDEVEPYKGL